MQEAGEHQHLKEGRGTVRDSRHLSAQLQNRRKNESDVQTLKAFDKISSSAAENETVCQLAVAAEREQTEQEQTGV